MIYLVRHGPTEMNLQGRIQGQGDAPLAEAGRELASKIGYRLGEKIGASDAAIVSSPLGRASETAAIIANTLQGDTPITVDDRLAEVNLGDWDGLTIPEIDEGWPGIRDAAPAGEWFFTAPHGESFESFRDRNASFLDDLERSGASVTILVTHGISGRILRGLHARMERQDMVTLPVPADAFFALDDDGSITEHAVK